MSFIRHGQEGQYVDIPGGSTCYLYDDGNTVGGWTYAEFAAIVFDALDPCTYLPDYDYFDDIADGIEDELGVEHMDSDYDGGIPQPERAEIFCQFVDSRIDDVDLSDDLLGGMRESFDRDEYMVSCEYCGKEFRQQIDLGEPYVCSDEECDKEHQADMYNVDVETIEGLEEAHRVGGKEAHEEYWDEYIEPNIDRDD